MCLSQKAMNYNTFPEHLLSDVLKIMGNSPQVWHWPPCQGSAHCRSGECAPTAACIYQCLRVLLRCLSWSPLSSKQSPTGKEIDVTTFAVYSRFCLCAWTRKHWQKRGCTAHATDLFYIARWNKVQWQLQGLLSDFQIRSAENAQDVHHKVLDEKSSVTTKSHF